MSTLFSHQVFILPQKNDSREGWFWCKKGVVCECGKMNFYVKTPPFAPDFGLFAAQCSAFWCKIECILLLNAVQYAAKRSAICR